MAARFLARRSLICAVALFIVILGIALGVGLGVGLAKRNSGSSSLASCTQPGQEKIIQLSVQPPANVSRRIGEAFISFAFEFASFNVFAGNKSSPGTYSNNLLDNLGTVMGAKPYVRVGGTSSDFAILDPNLDVSVTGRQPISQPVGTQMLYSDTFFESFETWPDTKFIYGFDLAHIVGGNVAAGWTSLNSTVPLICKALKDNRLVGWEFGNEPNLYNAPSHNFVGDASWNEDKYISTWKNGTDSIRQQLSATPECATLGDPAQFHLVGPSLWLPDGPRTDFTLKGLWSRGYNSENLIQSVSMHRYLLSNDVANTIANTLLNHTKTQKGLADVLAQYAELPPDAPPLVLGETNSISNIGQRGISNTFAGALWSMNWALWSASQNVTRVHFQQGDNFHYNAWQPVSNGLDLTDLSTQPVGTKPPYYGHIAAAYALGDSSHAAVQVLALPMDSEVDAAYAIYVDGTLKRAAIVNLREYNATDNSARPAHSYTFAMPTGSNLGQVAVHRLVGPASDAHAGVQWDGLQYDLEPSEGKPTPTNNVTTDEQFAICNGQVTIQLDDSSAAVLDFMP